MRKQDYLITLIKSLDANEKRHFKLFASSTGAEKSYLALFDILVASNEYNADELSATLKLNAAKLSDAKRYLVHVLLKSLRLYKDGVSTESYICNSIVEAIELMDRGLHAFALEIIDKAIAKAKKDEVVLLLSKLLFLKMKALVGLERYSEVNETVEAGFAQSEKMSRELIELTILNSNLIKVEQNRKPSDKQYDFAHPAFGMQPDDLNTNRARLTWFSIMTHYYSIRNNDSKAFLEFAKSEKIFYDKNPEVKAKFIVNYLVCLTKITGIEMAVENDVAAWQVNENLLQILKSKHEGLSPDYAKSLSLFASHLKIHLCFRLENYDEGLKICKEIWPVKHLLFDHVHYSVIFDYANILLQLDFFDEAVNKLDELLQINTDLRTDLQVYVRPLYILAQTGLKNYKLISYSIKSAKSWMKRRNLCDPEIELFFKYMYAISKANKEERKTQLQLLLTDINAGRLNQLETHTHLKRLISNLSL